MTVARLFFILVLGISPNLFTNKNQPIRPFLDPVKRQGSLLSSRDFSIDAIAKQVTVRVFPGEGAASGVIVAQTDNTYTVLTNEHVLANQATAQIAVMTADGITHSAKVFYCKCFKNLDLGFIQFRSSRPYKVVTFGNTQHLRSGQTLYSSGFPNYQYPNSQEIKFTFSWGIKAFQITQGQFSLFSQAPLARGYQLGYTNKVTDGMSGGPVLDYRGSLVGINGKLKYPIQGADVFVYADGSMPSAQLSRQMESLSWAIPVEAFQSQLTLVKVPTSQPRIWDLRL